MRRGLSPVVKTSALLMLAGILTVSNLARSLQAQRDLPPEVIAYADIVFHNGRILTADEGFRVVQALAVRDGKFLALGENQRILAMAGPETRKVDLNGKTVVPGFIESHMHGWTGNITSSPRRPGESRSIYETTFVGETVEEYLVKTKEVVAKHRPGEWVHIATLRNEVTINQLDRWQLDKISPNNPVRLKASPSESVLNSLALQEAFESGILTPDTIGVQKDEEDRPNGQLWGLAEGELNMNFLPWPEDWDTEWVNQQREQLRQNVETGITTRIGRATGLSVAILNELRERGELPLRVRVSHEFFRKNAKYLVDLKRLGNLSGVGDDWFKIIGTTSQQVDGGSIQGAIFTTRPKIRILPNSAYGPFGKSYWDVYPEGYVEQTIIDANSHGWNIVSLHTYGDASGELITKAFEKAAQVKPFKRRWVIDHSWWLTPESIERMKKLDVILSVLPWWEGRRAGGEGEMTEADLQVAESFGGVTDPMVYQFGPDNLLKWSAGRSLIEAGFKPIAETAGTPLESIQAFITRKDGQGRVWNPSERVSRRQALWMKTNWAAYYTMEEKKIGTIEAGKLADLVVLGGDYMTVPEDEISDIPVLMSVVGGQVMHEVPGEF